MAETPALYLETSIASYLASRPSPNLITRAKQDLTWQWWSGSQSAFDIYISEIVLQEAGTGDPERAARRLELLEGFSLLPITTQVLELGERYLKHLGLADNARVDLLHLACAVVHDLDYLMTWNLTHLANAIVRRRLQNLNTQWGLPIPVVATPEELLISPQEAQDG
ncbi:MAG: type II toxin-antitoxin system VapC family toxin [Candidatus Latescibacteria bacterium]|nr:type II toxin-antitoxin system VapC family toxin [Candidatus Latescibacterota bacterium]